VRGAARILVCACLLGAATAVVAETDAESDWLHLGPLRIRDLTPFGIQRLDFLPATALQQQPHTWALEINLSYQNTFVLSDNVADYLEAKSPGDRRVRFTREDAAILLNGDQEAYLIDGELGLFDLTGTYRFSRHWSAYATIPVLSFNDGIFDEFIESFHDRFGFDTAHRELVRQDDLSIMSRLGDRRLAVFDPPGDGLGDPVFGGRYALHDQPRKWNLVGEAAIKAAFRDHDFVHSSGRSDYGVQLSLQRFFERQALYLTFSEVYFSGFDPDTIDPPPVVRNWISTLVIAYERRFIGPVNGIFQLYRSPSTVEGTSLDELKQTKYQLTGGLQWQHKGWVWRLGVTENLRNFENTPDVGATVSVARFVLDRRQPASGAASASR
jgi:hypothetical protein